MPKGYHNQYYRDVIKPDPEKYLRKLEINDKYNFSKKGIKKRRETAKKYYEKNKEKIKKYRREYFKEHGR